MNAASAVNVVPALVLCPLLLSVVVKTKAFFAGRRGAPLLQPYRDVLKLLRKGAVYSRTTSWVFRAAPVVSLAAVLTAAALVPFPGAGAPLAFAGDFLLFAGLMGLMRFLTVIGALDTGSAFEGMGASREVQFSALAEPALLLALAAAARESGSLSLSAMLPGVSLGSVGPALAAAALCVVFLCENARIPFDDPNTHLELTMIHEVMVLDYGGPDLAMISYGAALKFWVLGSLVVGVALPGVGGAPVWAGALAGLGGMFALAVLVGTVESTMARLRLLRVPQLLAGATGVAALALILG